MKLTAITDPKALRIDTTVGTRIFVGNTMVHGDTGRRSVPDVTTAFDFSESNLHGIYIRRIGDTVTFTAAGLWISAQWITEIIPYGFRPYPNEYLSTRGIATVEGVARTFGNGGSLNRLNFATPFPQAGNSVTLTSTWTTTDPWPSTLPGLPA